MNGGKADGVVKGENAKDFSAELRELKSRGVEKEKEFLPKLVLTCKLLAIAPRVT